MKVKKHHLDEWPVIFSIWEFLSNTNVFYSRIGQTKNVFVHRLITQNTFEEKIDEMLKQKQSLSDMSVSVQESWITELSNEDLKKLFMRTP
jgi:predicted lipase